MRNQAFPVVRDERRHPGVVQNRGLIGHRCTLPGKWETKNEKSAVSPATERLFAQHRLPTRRAANAYG
jgi:hypothetical protein